MARQSLVAATVERFSDDVLEGRFPPGTQLPPEADLAERYGVSRLTAREAIKLLQAQGVVRGVPGRRSEVAPVAQWTGLEMLVRSVSRADDAGPVALQLVAVRRMIETGAAALAAEHRTDDDLAALERHLGGMRDAHTAADVDAFVRADIAFHDVVLRAGGNVFLAVVMEPLGRVLQHARRDTSSHEPVQRHAIAEHGHVLDAVRARDAERARDAMASHMDQTEADLRHFVLRQT
ncbi:FadR/GntR family transcriptional regulator [Pseudokineococcus lusitanus]|uniref:DNA-binding FadR family transcriptional regulator n=1 Tax=Pseudokineococcus lusitanus TaxID=763993 RepID=A0A3N1GWG1_9ACTN|nr:FadR/GntR family transcriptional regulator [Pseudokineococcus lusitanus]ROP34590.1 DNA-binding FadR family transcriptional regulator [Pseudokineococcus lusitanus]